MSSALYGTEEFGPYDRKKAAHEGLARVQARADSLGDGIERWYSGPYQDSHNEEGDTW